MNPKRARRTSVASLGLVVLVILTAGCATSRSEPGLEPGFTQREDGNALLFRAAYEEHFGAAPMDLLVEQAEVIVAELDAVALDSNYDCDELYGRFMNAVGVADGSGLSAEDISAVTGMMVGSFSDGPALTWLNSC